MPGTAHRVGTREEWLAARIALLEREKELTRRSDELARARRELPWVAVEREYRFDTEGREPDARRAVRRPARAHRLPLHVRTQRARGLPRLHVRRRPFRRGRLLPRQPRRDLPVRVAGAVGRHPRVQGAPGGGPSRGCPRGAATSTATSAPSPRPSARPARASTSPRPSTPARSTCADGAHGPQLTSRCKDGVVYHTYSAYDRGTDALNPTWQLLDRTPTGRVLPDGWPPRRVPID